MDFRVLVLQLVESVHLLLLLRLFEEAFGLGVERFYGAWVLRAAVKDVVGNVFLIGLYLVLVIIQDLADRRLPLRTLVLYHFNHLLFCFEILVEPLEFLSDYLLELQLFLIQDFAPLLKLHADQILHALLFFF